FWSVPEAAALLAAPGASALIARIPSLAPAAGAAIAGPTYNEHAAAFAANGWQVGPPQDMPGARASVIVHPNNPTGHWHAAAPDSALSIVDESFCDTDPSRSLIGAATRPGRLILKSFGKFWGLAGLRLGFAIGDPALIARLAEQLGPWPVSGPALAIGTAALSDPDWAAATRQRLQEDAARLDRLLTRTFTGTGARVAGGTPLFRLYETPDAAALQDRLARHRIWTRIFPWSPTLIRLGLPGPSGWDRLEQALAG
ncbi:aminotransferase class I/II-fold pyridoxal phosphate-dependent enzyme, partial [Pseudooceanicola sp. 216_PA32_1]